MVRYKLVRDNIPAITKAMKGADYYIAGKKEFEKMLRKKIIEEASEVAESSGAGLVEELGDMLEVLQELARTKGITWTEILKSKKKKAAVKGGFSKRIILKF